MEYAAFAVGSLLGGGFVAGYRESIERTLELIPKVRNLACMHSGFESMGTAQ